MKKRKLLFHLTEKNLLEKECDQAIVKIEAPKDVNRTGEFTLLDLGIDARHFGKNPTAPELSAYDTDVIINNAIDNDDLLKIGQEMLLNSNYALKNKPKKSCWITQQLLLFLTIILFILNQQRLSIHLPYLFFPKVSRYQFFRSDHMQQFVCR